MGKKLSTLIISLAINVALVLFYLKLGESHTQDKIQTNKVQRLRSIDIERDSLYQQYYTTQHVGQLLYAMHVGKNLEQIRQDLASINQRARRCQAQGLQNIPTCSIQQDSTLQINCGKVSFNLETESNGLQTDYRFFYPLGMIERIPGEK